METAAGISNRIETKTNKMDVHSVYVASPQSALTFYNIDRAEDSGYHTTLTPSTLECSVNTSNYYQSLITKTPFAEENQIGSITPELNFRRSSLLYNNHLKSRNENASDTPPPKRPVKRPYSSVEKPISTIPTPTTLIAGKIQSLEVNEDKENSTFSISTSSPVRVKSNTRVIYLLKNVCENTFTYPITPVKRNCRSSPCKRSAKKLDFAIHSLSCEKHELQPVQIPKATIKVKQQIVARPNQNIDIISLLSQNGVIPPLIVIFQHLTNEDLKNFCSVSPTWKDIWDSYKSSKRKKELRNHLKTAKENQENIVKDCIHREKYTKPCDGFLKDIQEIHENPVNNTSSPQYSPRTNRFRKFTKCASLDSRPQLSCVRCSEPAKVTDEVTGEQWVQCTNVSCFFQYCRSCNSSRHPGKSCFQYDLNAPSPSKRKKCDYAVGTRKSKKNLRRLL